MHAEVHTAEPAKHSPTAQPHTVTVVTAAGEEPLPPGRSRSSGRTAYFLTGR